MMPSSTAWMVGMARKISQIEKKTNFKQLQFLSCAAILESNTCDGEREPSVTLISENILKKSRKLVAGGKSSTCSQKTATNWETP